MEKMKIGTMFGESNLDDLDFGMGKKKPVSKLRKEYRGDIKWKN